MVDDALLLNNDFVVLVVYIVLRLEIPRISYMSTPLYNAGLIGLNVLDLVQSVIESSSQPYESY